MSLPTLVPEKVVKDQQFYRTDDHPFNKRGFRYRPCNTNPFFKKTGFSSTDIEPHTARLSYFDRSQGTLITQDAASLVCESGWRSSRANVGVCEGKWYFEFVVENANESAQAELPGQEAKKTNIHSQPHVRVGVARLEASLEAPVGYDAYGYGLRDVGGEKVHLSRPQKCLPEGGFCGGDVIGILIELPPVQAQLDIVQQQINEATPGDPSDATNYFGKPLGDAAVLHKTQQRNKKSKKMSDVERAQIRDITVDSVKDVRRDRIPIKYKNGKYYEEFEYQVTEPFEHLLNPVTVFGEKAVSDTRPFKPATLPGSKISVYKNGAFQSVAFENLYAFLPPSSRTGKSQARDKWYWNDGTLGYYPMISSFKNGVARLNGGPKLQFVPKDLESQISSGEIKLLSDRYKEVVAEDIVWDIVDEVTKE